MLLRHDIARGQLRPGDSLPPQREISRLIGISEVTVRRALRELAEEGLRAGSGTIVLDPATNGRKSVDGAESTSANI